VAEPTSRELAETVIGDRECWPDEAVNPDWLCDRIAAAIDAAVAARDDRWQRAVGMSLVTAESLASDPGAA
jgi:hypothetical protein